MNTVYAIVETFDAGYESEQRMVKEVFSLNQKIEVDSIVVESWITKIYLKGYKQSFNSVFFKIVDDNGNELDYIHGHECTQIRINQY